MSRPEASPNPFMKTADQWGGWLIEKIDGTKTPRQRKIKPFKLFEDGRLFKIVLSTGTTIGLLGAISMIAVGIDLQNQELSNTASLPTRDQNLIVAGPIAGCLGTTIAVLSGNLAPVRIRRKRS